MTSKAPTPQPEGVNRDNRPKASAAPPKPFAKIKDWDLFEKRTEQEKLFNVWCERKGYFPHTKYLEAWMEAVGLGYGE